MMECKLGAMPELLLDRPIGLLALHGRDGEDDGAKPKDETESNDGAKPEDDNNKEENDDDAKPKGGSESVETLTRKLASAEEARNRAADKRDELKVEVADLKSKIAKMEKDGSPDQAIKQENETLKTTNDKLVADNTQLRLEIALRDDKAHEWVDHSKVLKLADLSEVDFDAKTGQPRGLKAALDKLAKESPYLLKPKENENEDEGKPAPRGTAKPPAPKGTAKDAQAAAERARLQAKYPALRR